MITQATESAIEAVLFIAENQRPVTSMAISDHLGCPPRYLERHLQRLSGAGVLASARGRYGGYRLAKDPAEINLLQIIKTVEDESEPNPVGRVATFMVALEATDLAHAVFERHSLADLLKDEARREGGRQ